MTLAMHAFLHDKFIQLDGNLLIPLNTGLRSAAIGGGCFAYITLIFKQFNMLVHAKVPRRVYGNIDGYQ